MAYRATAAIEAPPEGPQSEGRQRVRARTGRTPGITLYQRKAGRWCAKWRDPDTRRWIQRDLHPEDARTIETRTRYARRLSENLRDRKQALGQGATRKTGTDVADLLAAYFGQSVLRPRTLEAYRDTAECFRAFCAAHGIRTGDEITTAVLARFAAHVRQKPKREPVKGGRRGQFRETSEPRSAYAINRELTAISAILNRLRKMQLLPLLSRDGIADALERMPIQRERKGHLTQEACQLLWAACSDSPIGAFVRLMLLTGMRLSEGRLLEWSEVDLSERLIRLPGTKAKTARSRLIDLEVTPSLLTLFEQLPRRGPYVFGRSDGRPLGDVRHQVAKLPFHGFQELRRTCSTYLCCMPSYGIYRAAERCGHSVAIAQRDYAGQVRIPPEVRTLEDAMGIGW